MVAAKSGPLGAAGRKAGCVIDLFFRMTMARALAVVGRTNILYTICVG